MCFDKICVSCYKMCAVCRKVKFITNITNVTGIHTFYFYKNKHTFIITDTKFTTKYKHFIKTHIGPLAIPSCLIILDQY